MTFIPLREEEGEVRMKAEPAKAGRGGGRKGEAEGGREGGELVSSGARQWGPRQEKEEKEKSKLIFS